MTLAEYLADRAAWVKRLRAEAARCARTAAKYRATLPTLAGHFEARETLYQRAAESADRCGRAG